MLVNRFLCPNWGYDSSLQVSLPRLALLQYPPSTQPDKDAAEAAAADALRQLAVAGGAQAPTLFRPRSLTQLTRTLTFQLQHHNHHPTSVLIRGWNLLFQPVFDLLSISRPPPAD